jgi:hypothetical protein
MICFQRYLGFTYPIQQSQIVDQPTGVIQMATKKKAKAPAKTNTKSKTAVVLAMLKRPNGVTRQQVLSMVEWPSISMQAVAKAAGVKLRVDESKRPFVYRV